MKHEKAISEKKVGRKALGNVGVFRRVDPLMVEAIDRCIDEWLEKRRAAPVNMPQYGVVNGKYEGAARSGYAQVVGAVGDCRAAGWVEASYLHANMPIPPITIEAFNGVDPTQSKGSNVSNASMDMGGGENELKKARMEVKQLLDSNEELTKQAGYWEERFNKAVNATDGQLGSYWKNEYGKLKKVLEAQHESST